MEEETKKAAQEKGKKRVQYTRLTQEEKAKVARYASENGVPNTLKHFKELGVKETSIRDWKRAYERELKRKCESSAPGQAVVVKALPVKKRGRPPLLGEKMDKSLQELILSMRGRGSPITTTITVGLARGLLLKSKNLSLDGFADSPELSREWAKSVLRRMGFTKRRANSTSKVLPDNFAEIKKTIFT